MSDQTSPAMPGGAPSLAEIVIQTKDVLTPGCFYCNPKGNVHGPTLAHEETILLEMYDGPHYPQAPDWYTDAQDAR